MKKEEYRPKKLFCVEKRSILNSFTLFKQTWTPLLQPFFRKGFQPRA